jgi:hypothetical protein
MAWSLPALVCVFASAAVLSASSAIGVAAAGGSFRLDDNVVSGNATVFDGNRVETGNATSEVDLFSGVKLRLATGSRATVYKDRLVLEAGASELTSGSGFMIEAGGLRIVPSEPGSARVAVRGRGKVEAAVLAGSFRVTRPVGTVIALMGPGRALAFELLAQEAGSQPPFQMTGCLELRQGRYVLRDIVAGVMEEVRGDRLDREVGNVVEVTATVVPGATPVAGAMEVIQISRLRRVSRGCPAAPAAAQPPAAKPPAAPPPAPAPAPPVTAKGGMSGATKAIIAGVAVGGGGAAAYFLTQKDNGETVSR